MLVGSRLATPLISEPAGLRTGPRTSPALEATKERALLPWRSLCSWYCQGVESKPGVGSKVDQPWPGKYTSTHAWASEAFTS